MMYTMLTNIMMYTLVPLGTIFCSVGVCYFIDPQKTSNILSRVGWETTKNYIWFKEESNNFFYNNEETGYSADEEEEKEPLNTVIYFDHYKNACVTDTSNIENIKDILNNDEFKLMFFEKNKDDIKRIKRVGKLNEICLNTINNIAIKKLDVSPFIQVEYIDKNSEKVINLHDKLDNFYVSNNLLFDKDFMELFLKFYYNEEISESYIIRIFDKDVNVIELDKTKCIRLMDDGSCKVISIDDINPINENLNNFLQFSDNDSDGSSCEN